ncbi:uncharacterized protein RAG0_15131 [Rhynchosporium agropyri]|uniref:Uncharacterized protein n=1 Tax=Rhynchosporium agropyri TaxID=914238 RepID=A0A1E1LJX3_9HELO|nr:uncharacterized protein RAG0_15131 [Rhynchosporium agropyri]
MVQITINESDLSGKVFDLLQDVGSNAMDANKSNLVAAARENGNP